MAHDARADLAPLSRGSVVGAIALAIALASASQDIAYDAYTVEVLRKEEQGAAVGARTRAVVGLGLTLAALETVAALAEGYQQGEIGDAAYEFQRQVDSGERSIVDGDDEIPADDDIEHWVLAYLRHAPLSLTLREINRLIAIDAKTGTFRATAYIDNEDGALAPGMFGRFSIAYEKHENALLVPRNAVLREDDQVVVYVVEDGAASRRAVKLGIEAAGEVEVLDGLSEDDQVVVTGHGSLRDGSRVLAAKAAQQTAG